MRLGREAGPSAGSRRVSWKRPNQETRQESCPAAEAMLNRGRKGQHRVTPGIITARSGAQPERPQLQCCTLRPSAGQGGCRGPPGAVKEGKRAADGHGPAGQGLAGPPQRPEGAPGQEARAPAPQGPAPPRCPRYRRRPGSGVAVFLARSHLFILIFRAPLPAPPTAAL